MRIQGHRLECEWAEKALPHLPSQKAGAPKVDERSSYSLWSKNVKLQFFKPTPGEKIAKDLAPSHVDALDSHWGLLWKRKLGAITVPNN
uniref:Uncharacterized protein n=1 Tax=Chromera velia CCMP2878 TaxID=1169474 RepID=A0A0G4HX97_9ALVE|eukprot:Cvel_9224.t1-p1 / transcript=Cvel_9224.t1 / gene=Cvel_9224 / organism=Chromera_velia_CCMP2878 / gene_product=hypothetical protein / transcript_product=hypothetical protein / location=Cvel_scaffold526:30026-33414(+) / protein_length=88 / sequence_SO=supercontig / SO=protein_coding / is_pseudo=false